MSQGSKIYYIGYDFRKFEKNKNKISIKKYTADFVALLSFLKNSLLAPTECPWKEQFPVKKITNATFWDVRG